MHSDKGLYAYDNPPDEGQAVGLVRSAAAVATKVASAGLVALLRSDSLNPKRTQWTEWRLVRVASLRPSPVRSTKVDVRRFWGLSTKVIVLRLRSWAWRRWLHESTIDCGFVAVCTFS